MMENQEDASYSRPSQLRPPSRIPSPGKGLSEITESQNNARAKGISRLAQPLKHKLTGSGGEPEPKRKSLVERAGEPKAAPVQQPATKFGYKGISLTNAGKALASKNNGSLSSSVSARPPTGHSRATSANNFSNSMGPSTRTPTSYGGRPKTAMGFTQSTNGSSYTKSQQEAELAAQEKLRDWGNIDRRIGEMMSMYESLKDSVEGSAAKHTGLEEAVELYKARITELETLRCELSASNKSLQSDLDLARKQTDHLQERLLRSTSQFDDQIRAHRLEMDNINQQHRNDMDKLRREKTDEIERLIRLHRDDLHALERRAASELEDKIKELEKRGDSRLDEEKARHMRELEVLELQIKSGQQDLNSSLHMKDVELQNMKGELENIKGQLEKERTLKGDAENTLVELRSSMHKTAAETATTVSTLEGTVASLRARIHFLESGSKAQSDSFAEMEARLQEAIQAAEISKQKLIKEETLRRILFNQVQELKGNIRVMCRIRPAFSDEKQVANISYPDVDKESKEIEILGKEEKSSLGNITRKTHAFSFDRVFGPSCTNQEVFGEISQLVQSALDGYNVCIFCYGQTGSGKTHTMSSADGMIPLATNQIYETATNLQEKGWKYTIEGSFIEVYNEEIHDLLGDPKEFDKKKHEIRHDDRKKQTTVTGLKQVPLDSPSTVESILEQAANNRSVAATKANERSSRSHSVFILRLFGKNNATNEISEGTLNLVDLAGSERLKHSGAEGDRMKETQNINKSLACLGDVIGALGQGKEGGHIPYRNSKLTYLLQYSLGGNSKTLMFVMASPLEAHLTETLTSLKFATKVHNTHIGTAKKSTKVREA